MMEPINEIEEEAINHTVSGWEKKRIGRRIAAADMEETNSVSYMKKRIGLVGSLHVRPSLFPTEQPNYTTKSTMIHV